MDGATVPRASVILDCGAHHLRAGYADEKGPRLDIPTLVGHPRHRGVAMAAGMHELEVGEEALVKRGMLTVNHLIRDGVVENWSDMEKLWSHVLFSELRVTPESHCFITTQPVNAPAAQKEKTLELMMETFNVHSLFLGTSQVLSLYCYGLTSGLVLDSGQDRTMAVPVHEGYALGRHVTESPVAGNVLTDYLGGLLRQEGYSLGTAVERTLLNQAKEDLCYVRPSVYQRAVMAPGTAAVRLAYAAPVPTATFGLTPFARSSSSEAAPKRVTAEPLAAAVAAVSGSPSCSTSLSRRQQQQQQHTSQGEPPSEFDGDTETIAVESFVLPDGQEVPLGSHRFRTTEVLFDFTLLGDDERYLPKSIVRTEMGEVFVPSMHKGVSWLPFAAINNCEVTLRPQLYSNIVIAGNSLAFRGARTRLEAEIVQLYRENHTSEAVTPIHVKDLACRGYSAWLGGAMLARTSMFHHLVVSRKEYEEEGLRVVHCKCL